MYERFARPYSKSNHGSTQEEHRESYNFYYAQIYSQISNIRGTNSHSFNVSPLVLQLPLAQAIDAR